MKNLLVFLPLLLLLNTGCQPEDKINEGEVPCELGCLFAVKDVQGTIVYMECFERYAIKTSYPDDPEMEIYGIPENVPKEFQVEGKEVKFSASFLENTLTPIFPDPAFNMEILFEIDIYSIE